MTILYGTNTFLREDKTLINFFSSVKVHLNLFQLRYIDKVSLAWKPIIGSIIWIFGGGLVAKSCPTLVTPWTVAHQAPLSKGFPRQEYWSELPFPSPGDLPNPGIEPRSPALQADSLPTELPGKPEQQWDSLIWRENSYGFNNYMFFLLPYRERTEYCIDIYCILCLIDCYE